MKQLDEIGHARSDDAERVVGRTMCRPDTLDTPERASHLVGL
jgi:hypothetical protein